LRLTCAANQVQEELKDINRESARKRFGAKRQDVEREKRGEADSRAEPRATGAE